MKLELTERQAQALHQAIRVFDASYQGWDAEEMGADTVKDLQCVERVMVKLESLLGWED